MFYILKMNYFFIKLTNNVLSNIVIFILVCPFFVLNFSFSKKYFIKLGKENKPQKIHIFVNHFQANI